MDHAGSDSPDEFHTEAAALMCEALPLPNREITKRLYLAHSTQMCPINMIKKLL